MVLLGVVPPFPVIFNSAPFALVFEMKRSTAVEPLPNAVVIGTTAALHTNPVPDVHCNALVEALQLGIENAVGDALEPVTFATTVLAACAARDDAATFDHVGVLDAPVDTIACPLVEPAGLSNWMGLSVVPNAADVTSESKAINSRFIRTSDEQRLSFGKSCLG
jgi:hypothetical protein